MRLTYNFSLSRLAKIQTLDISGYIGRWEIDILICSWTVKWYTFYEMKFGNIYQNKNFIYPLTQKSQFWELANSAKSVFIAAINNSEVSAAYNNNMYLLLVLH